MEHAARHLLYARFWHRFMYDIGLVPTKEPFSIRTAHGMVLGEDGEKISKSKGNGIDPNIISDEYGADTLEHTKCLWATMRLILHGVLMV